MAEVIPQRYQGAFLFSEGLAGVRIDGLYGFIARDWHDRHSPRFDLSAPFTMDWQKFWWSGARA